MAVQQRRKASFRRDMRRSHDALKPVQGLTHHVNAGLNSGCLHVVQQAPHLLGIDLAARPQGTVHGPLCGRARGAPGPGTP